MAQLTPGSHVVVRSGALVRRYNSEEEHYIEGMATGLIIQLTSTWYETGSMELTQRYLVLFSVDSRMYYVEATDLLTPDQASDPGRLFGRLRG